MLPTSKVVKRDKETHCTKTKRSVWQEEIITVKIYTPSIGASKYIKQVWIDLTGEIDSNRVIVGDFNTSVLAMDRSSTQKISKETSLSNCTLDQICLTHYSFQ